jgi:hypothetical protein
MRSNNMDDSHKCRITDLYARLDLDPCNNTVSGSDQYAAIDAYIDNLELPLVNHREFCRSPSTSNFCVKPNIALQSSIIAIIGTYARVNNVIFFVPPELDMSKFMSDISNIRSSTYPGSVISITGNKTSKMFTVSSHDTGLSCKLSESDMITVMTQLVDTDRSMTFYLDPDAHIYATHMHNNTSSMWVTQISKSIQIVGSHGSEIMLMLYSNGICITSE